MKQVYVTHVLVTVSTFKQVLFQEKITIWLFLYLKIIIFREMNFIKRLFALEEERHWRSFDVFDQHHSTSKENFFVAITRSNSTSTKRTTYSLNSSSHSTTSSSQKTYAKRDMQSKRQTSAAALKSKFRFLHKRKPKNSFAIQQRQDDVRSQTPDSTAKTRTFALMKKNTISNNAHDCGNQQEKEKELYDKLREANRTKVRQGKGTTQKLTRQQRPIICQSTNSQIIYCHSSRKEQRSYYNNFFISVPTARRQYIDPPSGEMLQVFIPPSSTTEPSFVSNESTIDDNSIDGYNYSTTTNTAC
ncbi:hypothetical protein BDF20DRAFT_481931 [Mycotypha africana]|uniref:uncharacterized protein n=1 Tax=Mycotypha africana TaxID=64632 RepID=UPI0023001375|nr:uncharacterized protein BDF20DRAFT_481931 [Mycotypha africana]KAI8979138.1 hypothetical protein BDF20DRAFT_481931 [Mycotypha africana]